MTVHSKPIIDGKHEEGKARKHTAIFSGSELRRMRTPFERAIGFVLLLGSVAGNVLAFNYGRLWPVTFAAFALGLGAQVGLTWLQWMYCPHGSRWYHRLTDLRWQYVGSVGIGAALSVVGYSALLYMPFFNLMAGIERLHFTIGTLTGPQLATWVLISVVSLVLEIIPENILVE